MAPNAALFIHPQGKYFSKFFLFLGTLIIVATGILAIFDIVWPLVFIPLGILFFIPTQQFEVDFQERKCRDCTKFLWLKMGSWQSIKEAKGIVISKENYSYLRESGLMAMDSKEEIESAYSVRFFIHQNKQIEIDEFKNKSQADNIANQLAELLKIPVVT